MENVALPNLTSLSLIESTNVDVAEIFKCAPNLSDLSIQFSENVLNVSLKLAIVRKYLIIFACR